MKIIKKLVDSIDDELKYAQEYAERFVEEKANNDSEWANTFRGMSEQEVDHAMKLHSYTTQKIEKLKAVYQPSQDMLGKWEKAHKEYVDGVARIKQMLAM